MGLAHRAHVPVFSLQKCSDHRSSGQHAAAFQQPRDDPVSWAPTRARVQTRRSVMPGSTPQPALGGIV